jgi:hypothetical protein
MATSDAGRISHSYKLPELKSADNWIRWSGSVQLYLRTMGLDDALTSEPTDDTSTYRHAQLPIYQVIGENISTMMIMQGW